jgi:hypothetical protein
MKKQTSKSPFGRRMKRLLFVAIGLLALAAAGIAAADNGATTTTDVTINGTQTIAFVNPCDTDQTGTAVITYNGIFHETDRPNHTYSLVSNLAGDFVLTLDAGGTITGHFATTFVIGGGENNTLSNVLTAEGTADDGSPFTIHFLVVQAQNGLGVFIVDLQKC